MRRVDGVSKRGAAHGPRGARSATGFSTGGPAAPAATPGLAAAPPVAMVGLSLLAAQENGDRSRRDSAARRRAVLLLDELRGLQAEMLGERAEPARLARLAALEAGEQGNDPAVREAVRAVSLRARIELERRRTR